MPGKKYQAALALVEDGKFYTLADAVTLLKKIAFAKFDETVEVTMVLGVDPRRLISSCAERSSFPTVLGSRKK